MSAQAQHPGACPGNVFWGSCERKAGREIAAPGPHLEVLANFRRLWGGTDHRPFSSDLIEAAQQHLSIGVQNPLGRGRETDRKVRRW